MFFIVFFQAEDGIRDLVRSRGLGDVYKRQAQQHVQGHHDAKADQVSARVALLLSEVHSMSPVDPAHVWRKALQ